MFPLFFLWIWISLWDPLLSTWRTSFNISGKVGLLAMNSLIWECISPWTVITLSSGRHCFRWGSTVYNKSFFSCCLQIFLFIYVFQQSCHNVSLVDLFVFISLGVCWALLIKSLSYYDVVIKCRKFFNNYFFKCFSWLFSFLLSSCYTHYT